MADFFDSFESRSQEQREAAQMGDLSAQIAHAKKNTVTYSKLFSEVVPANITSREALASLPLTRKDDLLEQQKKSLPFGGLTAVTPPAKTN